MEQLDPLWSFDMHASWHAWLSSLSRSICQVQIQPQFRWTPLQLQTMGWGGCVCLSHVAGHSHYVYCDWDSIRPVHTQSPALCPGRPSKSDTHTQVGVLFWDVVCKYEYVRLGRCRDGAALPPQVRGRSLPIDHVEWSHSVDGQHVIKSFITKNEFPWPLKRVPVAMPSRDELMLVAQVFHQCHGDNN